MKLSRTRQHGFSLVEVVLALAIAAFCLIGLLALLPAGLSSNKDAIQKTIASGFAAEVVADLRNAPANNAANNAGVSPRFRIEIPTSGPTNTMVSGSPQTIYFEENGSATDVGQSPTTSSRYRVSVGFRAPDTSGDSREVTMVRVLVTWPALADQSPNAWPTQYTGSYEVITALDRN
jgi:uncharacterized protein (TIGR02598 family)